MPDDNSSINRLLEIMAQLRNPDGGCPWDLAQDFDSIAPYTVEEAFEVADAIARGDYDELKDELGDLLLQVVFHARMAEEEGYFGFDDVVRAISEKMLRRHPHVFGEATDADPESVKQSWERIKADERRQKGREHASQLDGVPEGLPALQRAMKIQKKAARVGFDWPQTPPVLDQVAAELEELGEAVRSGERAHIDEEFGDLLFTMVNLSRHLEVDAEQSLRRAIHKFEKRFRYMEEESKQRGDSLADCSAEELERRWRNAKRR